LNIQAIEQNEQDRKVAILAAVTRITDANDKLLRGEISGVHLIASMRLAIREFDNDIAMAEDALSMQVCKVRR